MVHDEKHIYCLYYCGPDMLIVDVKEKTNMYLECGSRQFGAEGFCCVFPVNIASLSIHAIDDQTLLL